MNELLLNILEGLVATTRDVLPVVVVIAFFQFVLFRKPLDNPRRVIPGLILVVLGLYLFVEGLSIGLFPLGETMAQQFSRADHLPWVIPFAFALAYASTLAEPALIAVAMKAQEITTGGVREWPLRNAVALGAGGGLALGVYRIVHGGSMAWYICLCYLAVVVLTLLAPREIVPLAYDSGGVTTSTVTVPLVTALGIGLASNIPGRNPVMDGFGLVAFTALFPIMTVMGYATLARYWSRLRLPGARASRKEDE
ncbi:MAG: DUF1538 domain-containing protein [Nitrospirota bacterium]|nr:DUF1538 domain-containing protein [Nitrospirota bacterium]